jgi:hypothetical protein
MFNFNKNFYRALLLVLATGYVGLLSGCCHHWCYNRASECPPVTANAGAVRYGSVCDAPEGDTIISQAPRRSSVGSAPRPRVVVSESGSGSNGWRKSDPESMATTRMEGNIDDDARTR